MNVGTFITILFGLVMAISSQVILPYVVLKIRLWRHQVKKKNEENNDTLPTNEFSEELENNKAATEKRETNRLLFNIISINSTVFLIIWIYVFEAGIDLVSQAIPTSSTFITEYGINYGIGLLNLLFSITGIVYSVFHLVLEHFVSNDRYFVENFSNEPTALDTLTSLTYREPVIKFTVRCWHYEHKNSILSAVHLQNPEIDPDVVKVVDYEESETFIFKRCVDQSSGLDDLALPPVGLVRVNVNHLVLFGDQKTKDSFNKQKIDFYHRVTSQRKWCNHEMTTEIIIPGNRDVIASNWKVKGSSVWFNQRFYWLCVITGMKWLFTLICRLNIKTIDFQLFKVIYDE